MKLHARILLGLAAGAGLGALTRIPGAEGLQRVVLAAEPLGTAFIRLVSMVVVPLVIASLFVGIASLGELGRLGRIGGRTLLWFAATTLLAAAIGVTVALLAGIGATASSPPPGSVAPPVPGSRFPAAQTLLEMIPANPFAAAAQGQLLPLIVAVLIFGAAAMVSRSEGRRTVLAFFEGVNELAMTVIGWLMRLAPAAVLILIAVTVARSGLELLGQLGLYALTVVAALVLHVVLVLLPLLRLRAGLGAVAFVRATADALLLAFSTASSNATLPVSMAAARQRLGISNQVSGFVLPLGASLNKNGAAVYKAVTAVFLARLYGLPLSSGVILAILLLSVVAAFAGTGVPGSSLVTTLIVLDGIGLGTVAALGIALITGVDRPLDMCRTTVNTFGNLVVASVVARGEGEPLAVAPAAPG